jgi:hypothetical protein
MTAERDVVRIVAGALRAAVESGRLTPERHAAAVEAMQAGAVAVRRDDDGTIQVAIGAVCVVQMHLLDLPSVAADWETRITET